ncbi:MAG: M24 family metallopeptidase, partial [Candidatus Bathyarchaeia archaeon]
MKDGQSAPGSRYADAYKDKILPLRKRAEIQNIWLKERLETVLPEIMEREGFNMWIVTSRESNEDPVYFSLVPEPALYAKRRTILLFHLKDGELEKLNVYKSGFPGYYEAAWDPEKETQQECLGRIVRERDPESIGINTSQMTQYGDGLTHGDYLYLEKALGEKYMARTKSAMRLAWGWLERRIPGEIEVYESLVEITHAIIADAFSSRVITPGITTVDDVSWWMRQKIRDLGLLAWFQPGIDLQAVDVDMSPMGRSKGEGKRRVIKPGDLLHCDVGFRYLGLRTDVQQNAYVLRPGELDAPQGLKEALAAGNRLQEIHAEAMVAGRTGNEILKATLEKARGEEINPSVYTHPIGFHGHAAGPTIGLWDHQEGVPGRGDYELFDDTCYSIEL